MRAQIEVETLLRWLLNVAVFVALLRGTNAGFGYASDQEDLGTIDYRFQSYLQYLLLALNVFCVATAPGRVYAYVRSISITAWLILLGVTFTTFLSPLPIVSLKTSVAIAVISFPIALSVEQFGFRHVLSLIRKFSVAMLVLTAFYIALFPQFAFMIGEHEGALRGLFTHKNDFGAFCALSAALVYRPHFLRFDLRWFVRVLAALTAVGFVVMSKSSSAIVILVVTFGARVFFIPIINSTDPKGRLVIVAAYLNLVFLSTLGAKFGLYEVLLKALDRDPTLTGRVGLWDVLIDVVFERPLTGFGLGTFQQPEIMYQYSVAFGWDAKSTHNSFLDIYLAMGLLVGSATLGFVLARLARSALSRPGTRVEAANAGLKLALMSGLLLTAMVGGGVFVAPSFQWALIVAMISQAAPATIIAAAAPVRRPGRNAAFPTRRRLDDGDDDTTTVRPTYASIPHDGRIREN